ncbi:hypothetical protein D9M69_576250 [compost metagenome]
MHNIAEGRFRPANRQIFLMHHVCDASQQPPAKAATGVKAREILRLEITVHGKHHRNGIAHYQRCSRRTGGRKVVVAGFPLDRDIQRHVAVPGQR